MVNWLMSSALPRLKWWQANALAVTLHVTDMCHDCGHTRDCHEPLKNKCKANISWSDPDALICPCQGIDKWVKAEIRGIEL